MAVFEAYLVASFRGIIPSLVAEISSFFGFCPSQLTPLSWRTLMSIQVLGELYGISIGIHEVLYSYYFSPLTIMPGFYHLQPRDGTPLVEEPSRGTRGNYPFGNNWNSRYAFMKIQEPFFYPTLWRTVDVARPVSFLGEAVAKQVLTISWRFRRVPFLVSKEVLRHNRLWGNIARLPASVLYDEYQQAGTQRRRSFYTPPPRLARAAPPTARIRPDSVGTPTGGVPLMGIRQRLLAELFFLRNRLEGRTEHWDPEEEYRQHLLWSEGLGCRPGGFFPISPRSVRGVSSLRCSGDIGFGGPSGDPEDPGITVGPEGYKEPRGEAATNTCWDFAFCRSGAGHYRVPVLHAASAGSHSRSLCFAIWMSDPARGFLFLAAVPGGVFPWRVVPLSIAGYCFSLGSGDHDQDLSRAPASVDSLAIGDSRAVFPGDEGSQHGHEMGSCFHPAERPGLENSGLARYLCSPLAGYPLPQIRPV
ncbi:hypothetical protein F2Q69_00059402 [Brassica cretica]|uniref:Uncharacterized protein n=1 Tax=Brassica cretica TaxID=69181 RepID=A0A8S9RGX0_BRACR|nr:hypothetical protein F2Q69_00059402 [Brassica cretica]